MKNKIKLILLSFLIIGFTGCTTYIKDDTNKVIKNELTGQNLTENILCLPENEEVLDIYNTYNETASIPVDLNALDSCSKLTPINGEYEGIWTALVKSLAFVIIQIGLFLHSYGLALIISTILIRLILYPLTKKQAVQSENLKLAKPELAELEKKYKNNTAKDAAMQKSQEMMAIYKKFGINPLAGCVTGIMQIPLFFAFLEAINRIPVIFEETFLGIFQLGTSPATAVADGKYYYAIFIVLIAGATYFSFKLNSGASIGKEQEKQMKIMSNVMIVFMTIAAFSISTGIAIYWTISNLFTIAQNLLVKRGKKNVKNNK